MITKLLFTCIICLPCLCTVTAQSVVQKGTTYRYNGKNPRTPIGNVSIKAATSKNWVQSDSINGKFSILLNKLQMGSYIGKVQVMKKGMMVFNQQAVDEWSVRKDPFNLILCDVNEFEKQKANIIAIGKREAQKKYEHQIAELEAKLKSSKIKEEDYYNQLAAIQEELDKARKYMDEYADVFARIDESEIDSTAQRAIELLHNGEIDNAIFIFEQKDYLKELAKNSRVISKSEQLIATAEQAKTKAEEDRDRNIQSIKAQISAYKIKNEWEKAGVLLKGLADLLNTFWANYEYAGFCLEQGKYADGELYFKKTLQIGVDLVKEGKIDKHNSTYLLLQSSVKADFASLYFDLHNYSECEKLELESLNTFKYLASQTPENYESFLESIQYNLSVLYTETHRYDEAEQMLLSALEIGRNLAKKNPDSYEIELSMTQNSLAKLYRKTRKYDVSEKLFLEVLQTRKRLAEKSPEIYEKNLSNTMHSLAELYYDMGRNEDSENMYLNALSIRQHLFKKGDQTVRQQIADTQNDLALLYKDLKRYTESENLFKAALSVYLDMSLSYPQAYNEYVATIENNLGELYHITKEYEKSENMFLSAISIRQQLASVNHDLYAADYATSINNMAKVYSDKKKYEDSERMHLKAITIYQQLASKAPELYELELASAYYSLGTMYLSQEDNKGVVNYYQKALDIYRRYSNLKSGDKDKSFVASLTLWVHYTSIKNEILSRSIGDELLPKLKEKYELDHDSYQQYYGGLLGNQSFAYIFQKKFHEAELLAREGIKVDSSQHFIYTNLALSLLLQGKYEEAKNIYTEFKSELRTSFLDDLKQVEDAKIIPSKYQKDIIRIKELLSE